MPVQLPGLPWAARYRLLWDSGFEAPPGHARGPAAAVETGGSVIVPGAGTIRVYGASSVTPRPASPASPVERRSLLAR